MTVQTPHPLAAEPVLLVEDEPSYREMLLEAVAEMGFEVHGVANAEQGLRMLQKLPHGIVLLDLNLPGMSGMEFLEALRQQFVSVQVVILTGFGDLDAARQAMRCDVVDFITKPCQLDELEISLSRARMRRLAFLSSTLGSEDKSSSTDAGPAISLGDVERNHILAVMKKHGGHRQAVADELGISLRTLYNRLGQYRRSKLIP